MHVLCRCVSLGMGSNWVAVGQCKIHSYSPLFVEVRDYVGCVEFRSPEPIVFVLVQWTGSILPSVSEHSYFLNGTPARKCLSNLTLVDTERVRDEKCIILISSEGLRTCDNSRPVTMHRGRFEQDLHVMMLPGFKTSVRHMNNLKVESAATSADVSNLGIVGLLVVCTSMSLCITLQLSMGLHLPRLANILRHRQ